MALQDKAASLLNVRRGESPSVLSLFLFSFLLGASYVFFETTSNTLFLGTFGAASIPIIYLVSAFVLCLTGYVFSRIESRTTLSRLLNSSLLFLLTSVLVFYAALALASSRGVALGLMIWKDVLFTLSQLEFWALAGLLLDVRQGKRLFGIVSTGFVLADIVGGASAAAVVKMIGLPSLLAMSSAGMLLAFFVLRSVIKRFSGRWGSESSEEDQEDRPTFGALFRERFLRMFFVVAAFANLGFYLIDFIFLKQVEIRYPNEIHMAKFFGLFYAIVGIATLVSNIMISGRLLGRWGVGFGILSLPAFLGFGMAAAVLSALVPGLAGTLFWILIATKIGNEFISTSILTPSFQILYQVLPAGRRLKVQAVRESMVEPVAMAFSGLLLLFLTVVLGLSSPQIALVVLVVLFPWAALGAVLKRRYVAALKAALRRRRLEGDFLSLEDASSIDVLKKGLRSANPFEVISCLNILEDIQHRDLPQFLLTLLDHPAAEVRVDVLTRIARRRLASALPIVRDRVLRDTSTPVRRAALRAFISLGGPSAADESLPFLDDPDPGIRLEAFAGILRSGAGGALEVAGRLERIAESPKAEDRSFAARAIGEAKIPALSPVLVRLLEDNDIDVRRDALAAAGLIRDERLWETVIDSLEVPALRSAAVSALAAGGEAVIPSLTAAVTESKREASTRILLIRILGKLPGSEVTEFLIRQVDIPDQEVSYQVLRTLRARRYDASPDQRLVFEEKICQEAAAAAWLLDRRMALGASESFAFVKTGLTNGFHQVVKRVLLQLSFLYDSEAVIQAANHIVFETSPTHVARSLEVIDNLISRDLKRWVFPLIESLPPEDRLRQLHKVVPAPAAGTTSSLLKEISARAELWRDIWLEACALYAIAATKTVEARDILDERKTSPVMLLRETAVWALWKLDAERLSRHTAEAAASSEAPWVGLAHRLLATGAGAAAPFLLFEKVILLKNTVLFSETREDVLALIAGALEIVTAKAGSQIIREGEPGDRMYVLVKGRVRISTQRGMSIPLGAGDVFGEFALIDAAPRTASVAALDDATLFSIHRGTFRDILNDRTEVAFGFIRIMARRLRQKLEAKHALMRQRKIPMLPPRPAEDAADFETWLPLEHLLLLRSLPLFAQQSDPALAEIVGALRKVRARSGEKIIEKGAVGTSLYIIVAGLVRIHDGDETLAYLGRNEIFGELSVFDQEERMASATAETETQLFRLDQDIFYEILADRPEMAEAIMIELVRRLREEESLLSRLSSL